MKIHNLVSGKLKKKHLTLMSSNLYGHVVLVSAYLDLTAVN